MKQSSLRTAAAAAALATGLVTAAAATAAASPAEAAPTRITTSAQLADHIAQAVALEQSHGEAALGDVGGIVGRSADAPESSDGASS